MTITKLTRNRVRLSSDVGIYDSRTDRIYSEVVCKESEVSRYSEVEDE